MTKRANLRTAATLGRAFRAGLLSLHLSAALGVALTTAPRAAAEEPDRARLVLVVESLPDHFAVESLRRAIARELGVPVTLAGEAPPGWAAITLRAKSGKRILLSYRAPDGRITEREVDLPDEPARLVDVVSLLAGNLVRDEAAELATALRKRRSKPPPPSAAPADAPPPPASPTAAPDQGPPPAPVIVVVGEPPPRSSPCAREGAGETFAGVDLVPFIGSSSFTGTGVVRRLSLNLVAGYTAGLAGLELGGVANVESAFACGVQIAVGGNLTLGPVTGAQLALLGNAGTRLRGAQVGGVNVTAGDVRGIQLGLVNVATGAVEGVQIGLVNASDRSTFSLGLINIVRGGRTHVDVWGQESGLVMAALKHGGDHFHNLYGVGVRMVGDRGRLAFTAGIGGHFPLSGRFFLDTDLLAYTVHDPADFKRVTEITQARLILGVHVVKGISILAGPSYDVSLSRVDLDPTLSPYGSSRLYANTDVVLRGWPGLSLGVEVL